MFVYTLQEVDLEVAPPYKRAYPYFQLGFQQDGTTLIPTWEASLPLALQVVREIHHKSLDELDHYIKDIFIEAKAMESQTQ